MIVRLTNAQMNQVDKVVTSRSLAAALDAERHRPGKSMTWEIRAPYIAWRIVTTRMMRVHLSPRGAMTRRTAAFGAIRAMQGAMNSVDRHPAMRKMAMIGVQPGWFPVWQYDEVDLSVPHLPAYYTPMPQPDLRFVVLGPLIHQHHRAETVTTWDVGGLWPVGDWLTDPDVHLRLLADNH